MSKYYKVEDVIRKRAETLADTSYWEYGNPKNVDEWIEVAEMEFKDLPTIEVSEDCISREDIIKLLKDNKNYINADPYPHDCACDLVELAPSVVPTTEQSSTVGEWKPFDRTWGREIWACSVCEESVANMPTNGDKPLYDYCPNCGAKMKGESE